MVERVDDFRPYHYDLLYKRYLLPLLSPNAMQWNDDSPIIFYRERSEEIEYSGSSEPIPNRRDCDELVSVLRNIEIRPRSWKLDQS